jgi:hypothetical protein
MAMVIIGPYVLELFRFPLEEHHKVGFFFIGLAAILQIWLQQTSEIDKIGQVFEAKKVDVGGKFPRLVKEASND